VVLPGYNFISHVATANNGYGRGPDAQDTGDWITGIENTTRGGSFYGCGAVDSRSRPINQLAPSTWHGTHVTGIIAAQINNGIGITGIASNIQILPVRVMGKCGGYDSDIIDGMRWAAGIPVTGVPTNAHPAKILSMSLGGSRGAPCSSAYQSAVNDVNNTGASIVVAAGNDGSTTLSAPANCVGVIAVTANAIDGDNSWYSTIGQGTAISAPGGDCGGMNPNCNPANYPGVFSLLNTGTTTPIASPGGDTYVSYSGTSMATPHVAAVAALMLSVNPSLTPAQIKTYLQSTARPFPTNTICTSDFPGQCGAGMLDAYQAISAVKSATSQASSDCLFNWAERTYPTLLAPAGAVSATSAPYYYRYYAGTGNYLATSSADNHIWAYGLVSNNTLLDVGPIASFLTTAGCPRS
jgi:serine protease